MRRDPTTFIVWFSGWAVLCGVSFVLPNSLFDAVGLYRVMRDVYPNENVWGWTMIANGVMLLASLIQPSLTIRSLIAGISAMLWTFIGALVLGGGWLEGYLSILGAFSIWGAIGCFFSITQWLYVGAD